MSEERQDVEGLAKRETLHEEAKRINDPWPLDGFQAEDGYSAGFKDGQTIQARADLDALRTLQREVNALRAALRNVLIHTGRLPGEQRPDLLNGLLDSVWRIANEALDAARALTTEGGE